MVKDGLKLKHSICKPRNPRINLSFFAKKLSQLTDNFFLGYFRKSTEKALEKVGCFSLGNRRKETGDGKKG